MSPTDDIGRKLNELGRELKPRLQTALEAGRDHARRALGEASEAADRAVRSARGAVRPRAADPPATPPVYGQGHPTPPSATPAAQGSSDVADAVGWLIVIESACRDAVGTRYPLPPGELRIGRDERCQIRLPDDLDASRQHAMVRVEGRTAVVCDLGSRNGTFLNDAPVQRGRTLQDGDRLAVGGTVFLYKRA